MLQSDDARALRSAVERELHELEALCGEIEHALMRGDWHRLERAIADCRRITHALQNAMDASADVRDEQFTAEVTRRLRYVHAVREHQLSRLEQYRDGVGERLRRLAQSKSALRSMSRAQPALRPLAALDQLT